MNFFLGFCPDESSNHKVRKIIAEVGKVFDGLQIPVRWSDPALFHLYILSFGRKLSFLKLFWLRYKLRGYTIKPFKVVFNTVRIGISRKYKELIYLDLKEGGEEMREILFELRKRLNIRDQGNFIPHLVLGRVSEDLSNQEFTNISKDICKVANDLDIDEIEFQVTGLKIIKNSSKGFEILLELNQNQ